MEQKINFYALMKRKSRWSPLLVPSRLLAGFFSVALVLTVISSVDIIQAYHAAAIFSGIETRHQAAEDRLNILVRHAGGEISDALLYPSGAADAGRMRYLPDVLTALSKAAVKGLWLTIISVSVLDNKISLEGDTRTPALVQSLLQNMSAQTVFKEMNFQLDGLKEHILLEPKGASLLTFRIVGLG